ncbi:flagellar motor protein MotB [Candidatus Omnitrophota bacterium]
MRKRTICVISVLIIAIMLSGCTFIFQKGRRSDLERIEDLSRQLDELSVARQQLQERLSSEIGDKQVRLDMMEKGLVVTVVGDVLFDSGKAKIRDEAISILDTVAGVLVDTVPGLRIGIEGHTDNQPIRFSGWKSNWELSTGRALSVLHYMIDEKGVSPERISAVGYGEYHQVASNDSKEGRRLNRRVEIVILPKAKKVAEGEDSWQGQGVVK